ncbi:MAG TPA: CrcB family protein [Kofleriaceae bacterium]|nr:CrcB family protein [Kofleriaceae bacterium]
MERFLIVCGAGALGCGARYLIALWIGARAFPYATLAVNLAGSFAIALVLELSVRIAGFPPNLRLALTTGFLGGLTTYSSFNYESTALLSGGQAVRGLLYIAATLLGCFGTGLLGLALARRLTG